MEMPGVMFSPVAVPVFCFPGRGELCDISTSMSSEQ